MKEHQKVLSDVLSGSVPTKISKDNYSDINIFRELFESGYVDAIDASADDGLNYLEPRITMSGREYLSEIKSGEKWWGSFSNRIAVLGIVITLLGLMASYGLFK